LLAAAFLQEFAKENQKAVQHLSDESLRLLRGYRWPGNVRELRTVIEHGVVMCNGTEIGVDHLPQFLHMAPHVELTKSLFATKESQKGLASMDDLNLNALEQRVIQQALTRVDGNRTEAAELLGISRRTLQRKLKEYGYQ
jgi:DNA-binding NtrC family response regulator